MDDFRTQQSLDALAKLFLTGSEPVNSVQGASPAHVQARPVRMPPKMPSAAAMKTDVPTANPLTIPNLRLHRPQAAASSPPPDPRTLPARVEAVFLGNLPGFAGPWLAQYAYALSQQDGPVAILHVDGREIELELVTNRCPPLPQDLADEGEDPQEKIEEWIELAKGGDLVEIMDGLAGFAALPVRHWLVHLPSMPTGAIVAMAREIDAWTLLCGADETAIAAAYRLLKQLLTSRQPLPPREVGVMVMGADEAQGRAAATRLSHAASSFLQHGIHLIGCQKQMAPVSVVQVAAFQDADALWPNVAEFLRDLAASGSAVKVVEPLHAPLAPEQRAMTLDLEPEELSAALDELGHAPLNSLDEEPVSDEIDDQPLPEPPPIAPAAVSQTPPPQTPPPDAASLSQPRVGRADKPMPQREKPAGETWESASAPAPTAAAEPVSEINLARFISQCIALQARCPRHPSVQLALDQQGRLHLLGHVSKDAGIQAAASLRAALTQLLEARSWSMEHIELLELTQRQCLFDRSAEPTLHLFTNHAKAAASLAGVLGQVVKLHLLEQVHLGQASTWYCAELS